MDGPMSFKYFNNLLIGMLSGAHTEEIISGAANDDGSILKNTTVHGGIGAIGKET